jgi:Protein of unknown function (DUF3142)
MPTPLRPSKSLILGFIALACCLCLHSDAPHRSPSLPITRLSAFPRLTVWAWERREDLRTLDTHTFALAYLDQTLTLGLNVTAQPRRDPVAFPASATRIAVVRIEAPRTAALDAENRRQAVAALLTTAREPGIAALQIDFDATVSQRAFYRALLADLRRQMPPNLPLSITALVSWCSWDSWLRDLPVDEAVPMFFRMEPDHRRAAPSADDFRIREPLCQSSAGISTTESWPSNLAGKRVYIFSDRGWHNEPARNSTDASPSTSLTTAFAPTLARRLP